MRPDPDVAPTFDEQRAIPFDYTFRFDLRGELDRAHRGVITISVESSFTAVSIGYGVVPRVTPIIFGPVTITLNPPTLPAGVAGSEYNPQTITQTGGVEPVIFSLSEGALPADMNLSPRGVLSGTPPAPGVFPITVRATDAQGSFGERAYALEIISSGTPITITAARGAVSSPSLPSLRSITISNLFNGLQRRFPRTEIN